MSVERRFKLCTRQAGSLNYVSQAARIFLCYRAKMATCWLSRSLHFANVLLLIGPTCPVPSIQSSFLFPHPSERLSTGSWFKSLLLSGVELLAALTQSYAHYALLSVQHVHDVKPLGVCLLLFHQACSSCHKSLDMDTNEILQGGQDQSPLPK